MFGLSKREKGNDATTTVALIRKGYRRAYVEYFIGRRAKVEAEMSPGVVVLDRASEGVSPLLVISRLADLGWWLSGFRMRVMGWLWRTLTYGELPPLRDHTLGTRRCGNGSVRFRKRVRTARGAQRCPIGMGRRRPKSPR